MTLKDASLLFLIFFVLGILAGPLLVLLFFR